MKKLVLLFLIAALVLPSCENEPASSQPPLVAEQPPAEAPPVAGEELLKMVNRCALELFPKSLGVGGNPLRFDSLKLSPYGHHFRTKGGLFELPEAETPSWHVRIEEEPSSGAAVQIPNGVEFRVNPRSGACSHVVMD